MHEYIIYLIDKNGRKLLEVAMWGERDDENTMFIMGREFKYDDAFTNIIEPFLIGNFK